MRVLLDASLLGVKQSHNLQNEPQVAERVVQSRRCGGQRLKQSGAAARTGVVHCN